MSNRTLVELNHDYCPSSPMAMTAFAQCIADYMRSGNANDLPRGVTFKNRRHHSEPCPLEQPSPQEGKPDTEYNYAGAMADIDEICRVARDNPAGLLCFLHANYPNKVPMPTPPAGALTEWKDMSSAPKDGTYILAIINALHPTTGVPFAPEVLAWNSEYDMFHQEGNEDFNGDEIDVRLGREYSAKLTHWQPLPTPPLLAATEKRGCSAPRDGLGV